MPGVLARPDDSFRRDSRTGALRCLVADSLETFLARSTTEDPERAVPAFVEREFRKYLRCGVLAHGFVRLRCAACKHERLLALSCKGRGFCPRCGGRRMTERARELEGNVLPVVPVRQWVLSFPYRLRFLLATNHKLTLAVLRVAMRAVLSFYRRRAKRRGLDGRSGSVTVIQRFGGALNLNVHFHSLVMDGVFVESPEGLMFKALPPPSQRELETLLESIVTRVERLLVRRGLGSEHVDDIAPGEPSPLSSLVSASIVGEAGHGRPLLRIQRSAPTKSTKTKRLGARSGGFDLHAAVAVKATRRWALERLCRYLLRPALAQDRLEQRPDGYIVLKLKSEWSDGTTHLLLEPLDLLARLAVLVPRPRTNLILYHGLLAPNASARAQVVAHGRAAPRSAGERTTDRARGRSWANLMTHAFGLDVTRCPKCHDGLLIYLATVLEPRAIRRILQHLKLPSDPIHTAPARAPPGPDFEAMDFDFSA